VRSPRDRHRRIFGFGFPPFARPATLPTIWAAERVWPILNGSPNGTRPFAPSEALQEACPRRIKSTPDAAAVFLWLSDNRLFRFVRKNRLARKLVFAVRRRRNIDEAMARVRRAEHE